MDWLYVLSRSSVSTFAGSKTKRGIAFYTADSRLTLTPDSIPKTFAKTSFANMHTDLAYSLDEVDHAGLGVGHLPILG